MDIQKLREVIAENMTLDANDDFRQEKCWNIMTDILSADIQETIEYFRTECTDEEFFWLGSIFEDVAEKTQSKELIQVLRERLAKVLPETYQQQSFKSEHIRKWVNYAEYVRGLTSDIEFAKARIDDSEN